MVFKPGHSGNPNTQFKPGETGNLKGNFNRTPHLSTQIQNMLNAEIPDPDDIDELRKTTPIKVLIGVAIKRANAGDNKWADWLAKYGYGQKFELEHSGEITTGEVNPELSNDFTEYLKSKTKQ